MVKHAAMWLRRCSECVRVLLCSCQGVLNVCVSVGLPRCSECIRVFLWGCQCILSML